LTIRTQRLELRPMRREDGEELHLVYADPTTARYLSGDPPETIDRTIAHIERKMRHAAEHGFAPFSVVELDSGRVIGECGLQLLEGGPEVELGYKLGRAFRGRGYATESSLASLEYGFEQLALDRIVAVAWPDNAASIRVMEKAGMTFAGRGRHYGHETVVYEARLERSRSTASASRSSGTVSEMRKKPSPFGP
jgi:ribosomal-protein-alanine N-acetyltransferase